MGEADKIKVRESNENQCEHTRLKEQLNTLREVAETYRGRTIDNIIQNYEARIEHIESSNSVLYRYNYDVPIGEVFEYEGCRYKCVESGRECYGCAFDGTECNTKLICSIDYRADKKDVIFIREKGGAE